MTYKQDPPFCIQVEMTEGCNLYCEFCGLHGIREQKTKNLKFMTVKLAEKIALQIAELEWNSRIEFAMHGEPTMNPNHADIIKVFRDHLPKNQLMLCSNGGGLLKKEAVDNLFKAGLNILALDEYESVNIVPKLRAKLKDFSAADQHLYPEENVSPHTRYSKYCSKIIYIKDISSSTEGNHASLNNHCGCAAPLNDKASGARCAKPFRELSIRWNGKIAICCNDWRGVYKCGDVNKEPLDDIWHGEGLTVARRMLYHGLRTFAPCEGCDAISYRVGFLPDKKGKKTIPRPTIKYAIHKPSSFNEGRSLTVKIKREWE